MRTVVRRRARALPTGLTVCLALAGVSCGGDDDPKPAVDGGVDGGGDALLPPGAGDSGLDGAQPGADGGDASGPSAGRPVTEARLAGLTVPAGFSVRPYARELGNPVGLVRAPDGSVLVSRPVPGDVIRLRDVDGDGVAEQRTTVVAGVPGLSGLALAGDRLLVASESTVFSAPLGADGTAMAPMAIVLELPSGGRNPFRTLAVGPEGRLYITVGSSCDACVEANPRSATILRAGSGGADVGVLATGLRQALGLAFHPVSGELWATDQGAVEQGGDLFDELNRITQASDYGWPYCHGKKHPNFAIAPPAGGSIPAYCANTEGAQVELVARGGPAGLAFYTGTQFPADYQNDAFVAMYGQEPGLATSGFKVVRVSFEAGLPTTSDDFLTGFLIENGQAYFGRPAGVVVAVDGALLVSDAYNGIVYRIAHGTPPASPDAGAGG